MTNSISQIESITTGPRQSNFELLRIVAMFLVLVVHADFFSLGMPTQEDYTLNISNALTRSFIESMALVCVNVFVLISGWFGIKPSLKGFCNFIFQCAYFQFGVFFIAILTGLSPLTLKGILKCFDPNWFILAYIGLYICAPMLNRFIEHSSKKGIEVFLIAFYLLQTIYGFSGRATFFCQGYSTFSFMGLYILAKYIRTYWAEKLTSWGLATFIICALINTVLFYIRARLTHFFDITSYINPVTIISSIGLLLYFNGLKIRHNKRINWVAKSSFSVFLFHINWNIASTVYCPTVRYIYENFSGVKCIGGIMLFILIVYMCAIILDQPRRWMWGVYERMSRGA